MDNYLIYDNVDAANTRQQQITDACNFDDGITIRYADILKHPILDQWAMIVHPLYLQYFTQEEIDAAVELSSEWFS